MDTELNIIPADASLRDALERLNRLPGGEMTLFVIDGGKSRKVVGTLTDGDIRRALLGGRRLDDCVSEAMFRRFNFVREADTDSTDALRAMRRRHITMVPVLDDEGRLVDIIDLNRQTTQLPLSAILMAGGVGERLRPMTIDTPKPLLKVEGKAIIDYNVEALAAVGIKDVTVCTRYLSHKIAEHFRNPVAGIDVRCVVEDKPLGTIGAASLVGLPEQGNTLVMNSDLLTTISFEEMYRRHRDTASAITVGVIPYQLTVPYAILDTDGERVTGIEEKPAYSYYANAGIYMLANRLLRNLPSDRATDAPDLIQRAVDSGEKVTYYVVDGTWIDIGSPADYRRAQQLMLHYRNLSQRETF